jgi:hypothetical protein
MQISHLQVTDAKSWKGFTTENHLGAIWNEEPQKASELITKIQQRNFGMDIKGFLSKYPKKLFKNDNDYTWDIESVGVDNIALVQARIDGTAITAADQVGISNSEFELVFPKDWFSLTEVIVGHKNELYPIRIKEAGRSEGTNTVYVCELLTGDQNLFIPYDELVAGKLFSREYAPAERTGSQTGREIQHKSNISMRNAFSKIRIKKETPGNMADKILAIQLVNDKGQKFTTWSQYEAWKFNEEFSNDINRVLAFGKSNKTPLGHYTQKGVSGNYIAMGAGLREQCETSNYSTYTSFDIEDIASRLMDISANKLGTDDRNFLMATGEWGMYQFHKGMEEYSQLFTPTRDASRIYGAGSQAGVKMPMGYGGQFVEFNFINSIKLNVSVMQMYDDQARNKDLHPEGGTTESYRYDIWDFGTTSGEANIQLVGIEGKEAEKHVYIPGFHDPFSPTGAKAKMVVTPKDGWEEHKMWDGGVMVKDPTKTAHFVYNG